jgi:hypothetical protein
MLPYLGEEIFERMLMREGVIDEIPSQLCDPERANKIKNVVLVYIVEEMMIFAERACLLTLLLVQLLPHSF